MKVTQDVTWVGVLDPDLEVFDVVIPTEYGTTYNSYLIKAEKPALIDTVKANFTDQFLHRLRREIDLSKLTYLIVNHTEPDHSGAIPKLLAAAPHLTVYGSRAAIQFLREQVNRDFASVVVGHNDTLDLGNKTLRFLSTPFLHWPDTMFTYLVEDSVLFTCDGFGSHYCDPQGRMWASEIGGHMEHVKYYYDSIMSPFKPKILEAMEKTRALKDLRLIAPGHGPILDEDLLSYIQAYENWSSPAPTGERQVLVAYVSAYGHTRAMAEEIARGLESVPGVTARVEDIGQLTEDDMQSLLKDDYAGILLGSPTMNADAAQPIWHFLSHVNPIKAKNMLFAVFGNYGWSGEAVKLLEDRITVMRLALAQPGLKLRFSPDTEDRAKCREWGQDFGSALITSVAEHSA